MKHRTIIAVIGATALFTAGMAAGKIIAPTERMRLSRPFKRSILAGPPPSSLCTDDNRDAGKAVLGLVDQCLWVCFGEVGGWRCIQ